MLYHTHQKRGRAGLPDPAEEAAPLLLNKPFGNTVIIGQKRLITKDFVYSSIPVSGSSSSNRRRPAVEVTGRERMTDRALLAVPA